MKVKNNSQIVNNTADLALIAIIKIVIKLQSEDNILRYSQDPKILEHLGQDYKVKLGFGLHSGVAIEGAIGTEFKIDATYLSRDVEFAGTIESLTKSYGASILFSGELFNMLSSRVKNMP